MLNTQNGNTSIQYPFQDSHNNHLEICRLLAAAVVNPRFCRLLLEEPETALRNGYQGEKFFLNDMELSLVLSIQADSLVALTTKLVQVLGEHSTSFIHQTARTGVFTSLEQ